MPLPTFNPPVGPSPGTTKRPRFKILEADFGDGYSQPTPDGYNHRKDEVSLKWDGLTEAQMHAIYNFFEARGGTQPFYYRPAGYTTAQKWTCDDFDAKIDGGIWKISAKLKQSYTLET